MALSLEALPEAAIDFLAERRVATLSLPRPGAPPHVVPVAFTYDAALRRARVIGPGSTVKVRLIESGGSLAAAICQVDGHRWITLQGVARVRRDREVIDDAVAAFETRYRPAAPDPDRVVIEIAVDRALGRF